MERTKPDSRNRVDAEADTILSDFCKNLCTAQ